MTPAIRRRRLRSWRGALGSRGGAASWLINLKSDELTVLTLHATDNEELEWLLKTTQRVAHGCGVARVRLWETADLIGRAASLVKTRQPRDGSLPMLRPLHANVTAMQWRHVPRVLWL